MYPIDNIPHVLDDLLSAVRSRCMSAHDDRDDTRHMVALLADGLRYTASPSVNTPAKCPALIETVLRCVNVD